MKIQQLKKNTQAKVKRLAKELNISQEEVIARFERLFRGGKMSKHSRLFF